MPVSLPGTRPHAACTDFGTAGSTLLHATTTDTAATSVSTQLPEFPAAARRQPVYNKGNIAILPSMRPEKLQYCETMGSAHGVDSRALDAITTADSSPVMD